MFRRTTGLTAITSSIYEMGSSHLTEFGTLDSSNNNNSRLQNTNISKASVPDIPQSYLYDGLATLKLPLQLFVSQV